VFEKIKTREKYLEDILFIYERQATLWKIIWELIHEIKQPLAYFKWKLKKVELIIDNLDELIKYNENIVEFKDIAIRYRENAIRILRFLKNIEPLAINKRKEDYFSLHNILDLSFEPLLSLMKDWNIEKIIKGDDYKIYCDKTDVIVAISNFIDNSIYWLWISEKNNKKIEIETFIKENDLYILFKDNWIWLLKEELKDDIFDPWVTLKEKWTWLWLSIAWEVLKRNNILLSLIDSEEWFILQLIIKTWKK
jgi:nitrogen fixation/metabolism regulation signal transduction histidine kinase